MLWMESLERLSWVKMLCKTFFTTIPSRKNSQNHSRFLSLDGWLLRY